MSPHRKVLENGCVLFLGLGKNLFEGFDQTGLQIDQSAGGELLNQREQSAQKPRGLGKEIEGGLLRRVSKMMGMFAAQTFQLILAKPLSWR